jgi:hypothetical protein
MEAHSRAMVLGVWEGLLICYLVESGKVASSSEDDGGKDGVAYYINILGTGLAFGVGSRLFLDYTTTGDVEVLARGVVGMTVGVLIAEFAKHALLVYYDTPIVSDLKRKHRRRVHTHTDEEVLEGNVPPEASRSFAPATTAGAAPSSSRTRPTINTSTTAAEPIRVPVLSAGVTRDMLRAGRRDIGDDDESEESLERDATHAEGHRRRLQEEREWARSKGDAARSAELDAEIRRYKALSAELEKRLQRRRSTVYCKCILPRSDIVYVPDFPFFQRVPHRRTRKLLDHAGTRWSLSMIATLLSAHNSSTSSLIPYHPNLPQRQR